MFEFDAGKFIIIGIVALIVIGPKELPRVMRQLGQAVTKMRRMASDFQSQFMEAMNEADVAEIRAEAKKLADQAKIDVGFNPVAEVKAGLTEALSEPKQIAAATSSGPTSAETKPAEHSSEEITPEGAGGGIADVSHPHAAQSTGASHPEASAREPEIHMMGPKPPSLETSGTQAAETVADKPVSPPLAPLAIEPAAEPEPLPLRTSA